MAAYKWWAIHYFNDKSREFTDRFNKTISGQSLAVQNYVPENMAESLWHSMCYGITHYLLNVNFSVASIVIIMVNICMLIYLLNGFGQTMETVPERWSRMISVRTDRRIEILHSTSYTVISDSILHRITTALKDLFYSILRILNEFWLMAVHLFCMLYLFLYLFRIKNIRRCLGWIKTGLTDSEKLLRPNKKYKIFWRCELIYIIIAVIISNVVIFLPSILRITGTNYDQNIFSKEQYWSDADLAAFGYAEDISFILMNIANTKTLNEMDRERLYNLIDAQIVIDQKILDYDRTVIEGYAEFHTGLCALCRNDMKLIQEIRDSVEKSMIPSRELMIDYVYLRGQNFQWVLEAIAQRYQDTAVEKAYDL